MEDLDRTLTAPAQRAPSAAEMFPAIPDSVRTPLWYASRVLQVTALDWWEDGVPPSRGRRARQAAGQLQQRAVDQIQAVATVATAAVSSMSHGLRLHAPGRAPRRAPAAVPMLPALSGRLSAA